MKLFTKSMEPNTTLGVAERVAYMSGNIGIALINTIVATFLMFFYTDVMMLNAGIIGTILMVSRLFDGVTDIIMGMIVDRTHSKYGKARVWVIRTCIPYAISGLLLVCVPGGMTELVQYIYVFITYNICNSVFLTALYVPYNAMTCNITSNPYERGVLGIFVLFGATFGTLAVQSTVDAATKALGGDQRAWQIVVGIYAICGLILHLICFFGTKERCGSTSEKRKEMKKKEIIDKILQYHPNIEHYHGCDEYKSGFEEEKCTGIVSALVPTMEVLKKAVELGCNLLVVHEPIYYQTPDFPDWKGDFENSVQKEKEAYIREHRLTVWRDHDHMHTHQPDSIFAGVIKYLGWESYFNTEISGMMPFFYVFDIPECTVSELGEELKEKIGMNGVRIVGNPEDKMKRVAIVAHLYPNSAMVDEIKEDGYYHSYDMEIMKYMETENIDAIIPGEIIEWTILSYIRDAAYMGKHKACFNIGHFNMEELGMKYAADWIGELLNNEIPVNYIPTEDGWTFL